MEYRFKHTLRVLFLVFLVFSCKRDNDVDSFIKKYDNEDFSIFNSVNISYRDSKENLDIYVLSKKDENYPVYFIFYDRILGRIKNIDRSNLKKSAINDYFTDEEINVFFKNFMRYKFYVLGCDSNSNVFINPFQPNSPPYFLRLSHGSENRLMKKGYLYKHYKGNWYINTMFIDKDGNVGNVSK